MIYKLLDLYYYQGCYIAIMHHINKGTQIKKRFMFYSKSDVIRVLRSYYKCSVSHNFYGRGGVA